MLPANTKQIRPTAECEAMNLVYEQLKQASPRELKEMYDEAFLGYLETGDSDYELFAYQIRIEVQRRLEALK